MYGLKHFLKLYKNLENTLIYIIKNSVVYYVATVGNVQNYNISVKKRITLGR